MKAGVLKESYPGERRVALVPAIIPSLTKNGLDVVAEKGCGLAAGFRDEDYAGKGAGLESRENVFKQADILLQVRAAGANLETGKTDLESMRKDQVVIAAMEPLSEPGSIKELAEKGVTGFALELLPRITRAQSMDILSSMANIAGYKSVILAAHMLPRLFPMMMTAAGTITPARVFVVGAGVAGLQAIATAKRLGARVEAYDVRAAVKEQVESLGGKFVEMEIESGQAEDKGGYARDMGEDFYHRQRELMARVVKDCQVVITTAAIPGKKAPVLITREMVESMAPGSVVVDLAAERGGNCEATEAGQSVDVNGVQVLGPVNLPSTLPYHSSQMYSKNIATFLLHLFTKEGQMNINLEDEIIRETLVAKDGKVVNERVRQLLETPGKE